jgi:hypothetical protein
MTTTAADPFANYKAAQREGWASFLPVEVISTIPAAKLVKFAEVTPGQRLLDVACDAYSTSLAAPASWQSPPRAMAPRCLASI